MRLPPSSGDFILEIICSKNNNDPSLIRGKPAPKRPAYPRLSCSSLMIFFCLFPIHTKRGIRQHVIKFFIFQAINSKGIAKFNIGWILSFNQHVGFADGI